MKEEFIDALNALIKEYLKDGTPPIDIERDLRTTYYKMMDTNADIEDGEDRGGRDIY